MPAVNNKLEREYIHRVRVFAAAGAADFSARYKRDAGQRRTITAQNACTLRDYGLTLEPVAHGGL